MTSEIKRSAVAVRRGGLLQTLAQALSRAAGVAGERRRLGALTDAELKDLGLTRDQAAAEADRPFWDLPRR